MVNKVEECSTCKNCEICKLNEEFCNFTAAISGLKNNLKPTSIDLFQVTVKCRHYTEGEKNTVYRTASQFTFQEGDVPDDGVRMDAPTEKRYYCLRGSEGEYYGAVGTPTDIVDDYGRYLHVGDIVTMSHQYGIYISVVVQQYFREAFVMGYKMVYCNEVFSKAPSLEDEELWMDWKKSSKACDYKCEKIKDFKQLVEGEIILIPASQAAFITVEEVHYNVL